jgi:hypothetical protein
LPTGLPGIEGAGGVLFLGKREQAIPRGIRMEPPVEAGVREPIGGLFPAEDFLFGKNEPAGREKRLSV